MRFLVELWPSRHVYIFPFHLVTLVCFSCFLLLPVRTFGVRGIVPRELDFWMVPSVCVSSSTILTTMTCTFSFPNIVVVFQFYRPNHYCVDDWTFVRFLRTTWLNLSSVELHPFWYYSFWPFPPWRLDIFIIVVISLLILPLSQPYKVLFSGCVFLLL